MEKIKDFEWNDLVLYSKGWYENYSTNEDEFFAEIEKVIKLNEADLHKIVKSVIRELV